MKLILYHCSMAFWRNYLWLSMNLYISFTQQCKPCANRTRLALCRTGSDFLTVLDDNECPQPKPHTSEPCACVTSTAKPGEASSHSMEDDVTMATTQPGGVSEPPVVRSGPWCFLNVSVYTFYIYHYCFFSNLEYLQGYFQHLSKTN